MRWNDDPPGSGGQYNYVIDSGQSPSFKHLKKIYSSPSLEFLGSMSPTSLIMDSKGSSIQVNAPDDDSPNDPLANLPVSLIVL